MILTIDTASPLQSVALGTADGVFVRSSGERFWAEQLLSQVRDLLDEAKSNPEDLAAVVAVRGPGSFTGIRIGLSVALGLHQSLGIPAGTVATHDLLDAAALDRDPELPSGCVAAVDALRGWWFVRAICTLDVSSATRCNDGAEGIRRLRREDVSDLEAPLYVGFGTEVIVPGRAYEPGALAPHAVDLSQRGLMPPSAADASTLSSPLYLQQPELQRRDPPRAIATAERSKTSGVA